MDHRFWKISKEGHASIIARTKAGAYEAWDSYGRHDVTVEYHRIWEATDGKKYDSCYPVTRLARRPLKSGEVNYCFSYGKAIYDKEVKQ